MNIQSLYDGGRFPHAVLLSGGDSDDVKRVLELHQCAPADTVYVKELMPDEAYKIAPLREVIASGNLRPQFGETRVFVFNDFDMMGESYHGEQCQNALLKFIEEPHEFNRFVITAGSTAKILPTILSRVVVIREKENGDNNAVDKPTDSEIIASAIISALAKKNEYALATEFARIKDRQALAAVLQALIQKLSVIMRTAKNPARVISVTDIIQKYIRRLEVNPNIQITITSCAADIYTTFIES
ncbi:MAG: hypothetical protein FWF94_07545 [Oscillospiraceae bacterium]|nr:hypothetical protein [Oscillospiraceae bacterium]